MMPRFSSYLSSYLLIYIMLRTYCTDAYVCEYMHVHSSPSDVMLILRVIFSMHP